MQRRALVLTDESARHPMRARLPHHAKEGDLPLPLRRSWLLSAQELREFGMAYCACFMAVMAFIA